MWKYILGLICVFVCPAAYAEGLFGIPDIKVDSADFVSAEEIAALRPTNDTTCATKFFADALYNNSADISESDDELLVRAWVYTNFYRADVIKRVLECPEFQGISDTEIIKFIPIKYTFPAGREIVVNYETQPKVLKQRLLLANRPQLPDGPNNPDIMNDESAVWTNTNPAWYAIMVTQAGALSDMVGVGKNNVVSLKYIAENIDKLYPRDNGRGECTSRSGSEWTGGNNNDMINRVVHKTVDVEKDPNDYYVAGDINLQWLSYMEIALDVVITVVTVGGGLAAKGATTAARASKTSKNLIKSWKELRNVDAVKDYITLSNNSKKIAKELKTIDKATDAARYAELTEQAKTIKQQLSDIEKYEDVVKQYKNVSKSISEMQKITRAYKNLRKVPKTGNVITRTWRAIKAIRNSTKKIDKAAKVARSGMKAGRTKDWLFHSTMKNLGRVAKIEAAGGLLYGVLHFVGEMYDWTETHTDEFTSGLEFAPLLLLSADDLEGQENVINYGMWLLWAGDYTSAADDDAAYLQAMDFAEKFHQDLSETQEEENNLSCDVDIYVVRPIIRNPGESDAALYYLFMNDTPWTTHGL